MDTLFILAGVLGVGDLVLMRIYWRERRLRRKAERSADGYIRDNYRLMDALERKAGIRSASKGVVLPLSHARLRSGSAAGTPRGPAGGSDPDPRLTEQGA